MATKEILLGGFFVLLLLAAATVGILYATGVIGGNGGNGGGNGGNGGGGNNNGGGGNGGGGNNNGGNGGGGNNNNGDLKILVNNASPTTFAKITPNGARLIENRSDATRVVKEETQDSAGNNSVFRLRRANSDSGTKEYVFSKFVQTIGEGRGVYTMGFQQDTRETGWFIFKDTTIASSTGFSERGFGLVPYSGSAANVIFGSNLEGDKLYYILFNPDVGENPPNIITLEDP